MIGVVHASRPIDAIQRFISRLELGVIPQVVDTVIFLKGGRIEKVFEQLMTVKVPTGMTESDLTRPVIEVRDFFTGKLEFDIFTFGEETTIMPVNRSAGGGGGKARVFDERELSKTRSLVQREIVRLTRARDEDVTDRFCILPSIPLNPTPARRRCALLAFSRDGLWLSRASL